MLTAILWVGNIHHLLAFLGPILLGYKEWTIFQISFLGIFINHFICCYVAKNWLLRGNFLFFKEEVGEKALIKTLQIVARCEC